MHELYCIHPDVIIFLIPYDYRAILNLFCVVSPSLTPEAMDVEVEVGTRLTLTVNITEFNREIDTLMWTRNGMAIENGTNGYTLTNISLEAPLSMVSLTRENITSPAEDSGNYTVSMTNAAGSDASEFNVTVTGEFIDVTKLRNYNIKFSLSPFPLFVYSQLVQVSLLPQ